MSRMFIPLFALFVMHVGASTIYAQTITHGTYDIVKPPNQNNWYVSPLGPYTIAPGHTLDHIRIELNEIVTATGAINTIFSSDPSNYDAVQKKWLAGQFGPLPSTPAGSTLTCLAILYYRNGAGMLLSVQGQKTLSSVP